MEVIGELQAQYAEECACISARAPNFGKAGEERCQLFWIIKNGLSFVGTPGFGDPYDEQGIRALLAYARGLGKGGAGAFTPTPSQRPPLREVRLQGRSKPPNLPASRGRRS